MIIHHCEFKLTAIVRTLIFVLNIQYRSILIFALSFVVNVWKIELKRSFFDLVIKYYIEIVIRSVLIDRSFIFNSSVHHLKNYLTDLNNLNSNTTKIIILSSYSIWRKRIIDFFVESKSRKNKEKKTVSKLKVNENDDLKKKKQELFENILRFLRFKIIDFFNRVVLNEVHKIKSIRIKTVQIIAFLEAFHFIFFYCDVYNKSIDWFWRNFINVMKRFMKSKFRFKIKYVRCRNLWDNWCRIEKISVFSQLSMISTMSEFRKWSTNERTDSIDDDIIHFAFAAISSHHDRLNERVEKNSKNWNKYFVISNHDNRISNEFLSNKRI